MAREVNTVLGKIMSEQRGIPEAKAEDIVKAMRSANQYQVCVNNPQILFLLSSPLRRSPTQSMHAKCLRLTINE